MNEYKEDIGVLKDNVDLDKLTTWSNEPVLADLRDDYTGAFNNQNSFIKNIEKWSNIKNVEGEYKPKKVKNSSGIQPKTARKHLEWRYPSLSEPFLESNNIFKIDPRTFEDVLASKQNEVLLNYQFNVLLNKVSFIDEFIRRNVDQGLCIVKTYWERETKEVIKEVPIFAYSEITSEEQMQELQDAIELKSKNYNFFKNLPEEIQEAVKYFNETQQATVVQIVDYVKEKQEEIIKNQPKLDIIDPRNFFIDPSCGSDYMSARFIVVSWETSKAELEKTGKYKNLDKINYDTHNVNIDSTVRNSDFNFKDIPRKRVTAYEYWGLYDINNTGELVPILVTWVNDTIIGMEENPFPKGKLPFVISTYIPVLNTMFGESDIELLEDSQKLIGAITRGVVDLIGKSANSQKGYRKGFLDATQRQRFDDGMDYEYNGSGVPQQDIYQHTYPEIPQTVLMLMQQQAQEAESLTGIKAFNEGINGNQFGSLAASVRGTLNATSKRESSILRRLVKAIQEIGNNICMMNSEFLSDEEVIRVTNSNFQRIRKNDLSGNFDLVVKIDSPDVNEKKASDLAFILQTLGPSSPLEVTKSIMSHIARLKNLPDLEEEILNIPLPEPTPEQQKLAQLEVRIKELEAQKLESEIKMNEAKALEYEAKAQGEIIDNEEQATGIKHERDLENIKSQGKINKELAVTKSILDNESNPEKVMQAVGYNEVTKDT